MTGRPLQRQEPDGTRAVGESRREHHEEKRERSTSDRASVTGLGSPYRTESAIWMSIAHLSLSGVEPAARMYVPARTHVARII